MGVLSFKAPNSIHGPKITLDAGGRRLVPGHFIEFERKGASRLLMHPEILIHLASLQSDGVLKIGRLEAVECLHLPPTVVLAFSAEGQFTGVVTNFASTSRNPDAT